MDARRPVLSWLLAQAAGLLFPLAAVLALAAVIFLWHPQRGREHLQRGAWTCSMHPQVRADRPGRCPICGMALIPVSEIAGEQALLEARAGLAVEPIGYRELFKEIRTVGKLGYNERLVAYITARVSGRVDRVYADFTGISVKANDHLVDIYSPELYTAQAELLRAAAALKNVAGDSRFAQMNLEAARTKLRLLGILPEQIAEIEQTGREKTHLTIHAPIGGIVIEKNVREQQYVKEGDMLYRIAQFDPLWLYIDVFEYDLAWIQYGQAVDVTVEAFPGRSFPGTIVFIDPYLDDITRTVKVRVNLPNPDGLLKPAMYASAAIHARLGPDGTVQPTGLEGKYMCPMHPEAIGDGPGTCELCGMPLEPVQDPYSGRRLSSMAPAVAAPGPEGKVLAIPRSAVLDTGRRRVAYRRRPDGAYELVELTLGPLAQGRDDAGRTAAYYPVLAGLAAGDQVVVQGGFLLDSQRQIEGMPNLLYPEGRPAAGPHAGHGTQPAPKRGQAPAARTHEHKQPP